MKILSIEFDYEYNNLISAAINSSVAKGTFWTSGSDEGCEGKFSWCSVKKLVRNQEAKWFPQQPDNFGGKENCVTIGLSKTVALLSDVDCSSSNRYICEARDTRNTPVNSDAIVEECAAVFNVSKEETQKTEDLCGMVNDERVLLLAEMFAESSDELLQENMIAISTCSSKKGMDECDTAALIFQCGQETAPQLVTNLINTAQLDTTAESVPLPRIAPKCLTDFSCVIDQSMRDDYLNNRVTTNAETFTACGIKYLLDYQARSYQDASSLCCKYGLKLASIENAEELFCINRSSMGMNFREEWIHTWVAASRLGASDPSDYRWCTSSGRFNLLPEIPDRYPERISYLDWYLFSIKFRPPAAIPVVLVARDRLSSRLPTLCKP
ncbi:uncharacterized protein LOC135945082 [Cloeon dipterum]|uniref:uncharacterized protein LOC135945082 n=1 Tax=Cloeon dipterum TaxID=197152 RepID=UPI00321F8A04